MKKLITLALLSAAIAAQAQPVWRCGTDGRSYANTPCNDGRVVALADARSTADTQSAQALASRERGLAEALRRERLQREAQPGTLAQSLGRSPVALVKPEERSPLPRRHAKAKHPQAADADIWRAVAPASRRKKG